MRLCRFDDNRLGLVADDGIRDVSEALARLPAARYPFPPHDALIAHLDLLRPEIERLAERAAPRPVEGVRLVHLDRRNDHEVELAVVIGRKARNVSAAEALGCVAGYCIGLDMTIRGPEERSLRKSPDSYCILGPWLATRDEITDPGDLSLEIEVNGELRQRAHTGELILGVAELIAWGSTFYTLHPGDVLLAVSAA